MKQFSGAVYDPRTPGMPIVAIILNEAGKVIGGHAVDTEEAGKRFIKVLLEGLRAAAAIQPVLAANSRFHAPHRTGG